MRSAAMLAVLFCPLLSTSATAFLPPAVPRRVSAQQGVAGENPADRAPGWWSTGPTTYHCRPALPLLVSMQTKRSICGGEGGDGGAQDIAIREATWESDAKDLSGIRRVVFIEEQNVSEEDEWEGGEEDCWHWMAVVDGRPVGTARLKPNGTIGRMAVLKDFRSRGVGTSLMQRATNKVRSLGLGTAQLNAQTHAVAFYARFGFRVEGAEFQDAGIPHVRMTLNLSSARIGRCSTMSSTDL